jgi:hypothetical protein
MVLPAQKYRRPWRRLAGGGYWRRRSELRPTISPRRRPKSRGGGRQRLGAAGRRAGASPDKKHGSAAGFPVWARVAPSRSPRLGSLRAGRKIDPDAKIARLIIRTRVKSTSLEVDTRHQQGREGSEVGRLRSSSPDRRLFPLAAVSTPHFIEFTTPPASSRAAFDNSRPLSG